MKAGLVGFALLSAVLLPPTAAAQTGNDESIDPTSAREAQVQDDLRARTHFDAGLSHYEEGAYDRARIEFLRAWELSRRPPLLLNLATVHERLGMHAEAAENLREYLRVSPDAAERRELLTRRIANLERLARERTEAQTPPAITPATQTEERDAVVAPPSGPDGGLLAVAGIAYGLGGAGLVLTAIFGGLALAEDQRLSDTCGVTTRCTVDDVSDAAAYVITADVGLGVGLGSVALGTVLLIVALASAPSGERAQARLGRGGTLEVHF